jgi:hypothetical protein
MNCQLYIGYSPCVTVGMRMGADGMRFSFLDVADVSGQTNRQTTGKRKSLP